MSARSVGWFALFCICFASIGLVHADVVGDCIAIEFVSYTNSTADACAKMDQAVDRAIQEGWVIRRVDIRQDPLLAQKWHIHSTPTTILIHGGREVDRLLGSCDYNTLTRRMTSASSPDRFRERNLGRNDGPSNMLRSQEKSLQEKSLQEKSPQEKSIVPVNGLARSENTNQVQPAVFHTPSSNPAAMASPSALNNVVQASNWDRTRDGLANNQASFPPSPAAGVSMSAAEDIGSKIQAAERASVRIRVNDSSFDAIGSGTIIDTHQGEALVLTCGHLFRGVTANGRVTIDTFLNGQQRSYPGTIIDYRIDDKVDIGLVAFRADVPLSVASLIDHTKRLREGEPVFSMGCDHGQEPSKRVTRISKLNRYLGESNVEIAGMPVQGRSGGGLFNEQGELIGVCNAADEEYDEGLYSGPDVLYKQLSRLGLERLYHRQTKPVNSGDLQVAVQQQTQGVIESAAAEMVVIMRDRAGNERKVQLNNPSPQLLQAIAAENSTRIR